MAFNYASILVSSRHSASSHLGKKLPSQEQSQTTTQQGQNTTTTTPTTTTNAKMINLISAFPAQPQQIPPFSPLITAAAVGNIAAVQASLSSGLSVNGTDKNGNSAIMWATRFGKTDVVRQLVSSGANINLQNFEGKTALHFAVEKEDLELVEHLCNNGANVNIEDLDGIRPCHKATVLGNYELLSTLSKHGAFLAAVDDAGDGILHMAVRESKPKMVEFIITKFLNSIDVNARNNDLETALDLAVELDEQESVTLLKPIVEQVQGGGRSKRKYESEEAFTFEDEEVYREKHAKFDSIYWGCPQLITAQL